MRNHLICWEVSLYDYQVLFIAGIEQIIGNSASAQTAAKLMAE